VEVSHHAAIPAFYNHYIFGVCRLGANQPC
jgi:hypothetical protein